MCYDCIRELSHADVAQSVVRRIGSAEVTGSIPVSSFGKARIYGLFLILKVLERGKYE